MPVFGPLADGQPACRALVLLLPAFTDTASAIAGVGYQRDRSAFVSRQGFFNLVPVAMALFPPTSYANNRLRIYGRPNGNLPYNNIWVGRAAQFFLKEGLIEKLAQATEPIGFTIVRPYVFIDSDGDGQTKVSIINRLSISARPGPVTL